MSSSDLKLELMPAAVDVETLASGGMILRSPSPLEPYEAHLGEMLRRWAGERPDRTFLAERSGDGWRKLIYAEALGQAEAIGQSLAARGLGPERPLVILSGNSIDHALITLGSLLAGVPVAPVSPAYSLMSRDYGKLRHVWDCVQPGMVFVEQAAPFAAALASVDLSATEVVTSGAIAGDLAMTPLAELQDATPGAELRAAEARVGPETVAKVLFTSGSTGTPKGVLNTHRMLCSNQQMIAQCWPFLEKTPPVLVDWLPWNHTFGANHNFNLVLKHGGTLHIDAGKPAPDLFAETVRNLRETSPTLYFNVPAGFAQLVAVLERDGALRASFFRRLQLIFYAGAALPQDLWQRLEALSLATLGRKVLMASAWGSTETAPLATSVHFSIDQAGVIGLPAPGVELKLLPAGSKLEMRVKGPNVTPGYLRDPELTLNAFDEDRFYKIGDAGRLADPANPSKGLVFDGRVAENFKLVTGTWVHVGALRVQALAAAAPVLQDAVVTGHDRPWIGLLAWLNVAGCQAICATEARNDSALLVRDPAVIRHVREAIARHNAEHPASSTRIARVLLMAEPASIDADEITDKGYVNQLATLERRADLVERLYLNEPPEDVIVVTTPADV
ncbi:MAG: feruloyl-CoA synthase [Acidobacteriota bacterium]